MIHIDMTKTVVTDKQAAKFMLEILELYQKESLVINDIQFRSKSSQAKEMIRLKKGREKFLNALDELVKISDQLKDFASMDSDAQIDKLLHVLEALIGLSVSIVNVENENCRNNCDIL
ncbi:hypothetical protein [Lacrimispora xylanolytica]|uniref:Uncharacterized protein n=1 Tax=Lacrimispora xylanolytica TaxID=29375 RepID=A0ABY7AH66_9FIRM|nr:hypothetical protein [Lacrimispora xylanolytica]WAJ25169.1 hypothetical protein OW255_06580 [Lacrimispora xylanolytica]